MRSISAYGSLFAYYFALYASNAVSWTFGLTFPVSGKNSAACCEFPLKIMSPSLVNDKLEFLKFFFDSPSSLIFGCLRSYILLLSVYSSLSARFSLPIYLRKEARANLFGGSCLNKTFLVSGFSMELNLG